MPRNGTARNMVVLFPFFDRSMLPSMMAEPGDIPKTRWGFLSCHNHTNTGCLQTFGYIPFSLSWRWYLSVLFFFYLHVHKHEWCEKSTFSYAYWPSSCLSWARVYSSNLCMDLLEFFIVTFCECFIELGYSLLDLLCANIFSHSLFSRVSLY